VTLLYSSSLAAMPSALGWPYSAMAQRPAIAGEDARARWSGKQEQGTGLGHREPGGRWWRRRRRRRRGRRSELPQCRDSDASW
jgi:hypothetical protein